jgi:hypothetical protein
MHPFDACIKAAQSAGFAEGLALRVQEVQNLAAKLRAFERHIAQLEEHLRGSEVSEAEKMGDFCHHQGTTNGTSNVPTTMNKTVVATAHVFHEFVPRAPFHPPISHPTATLPTDSVIPLRINSLLKHNKHQLPSKSPNTWGSLALCHVRCTHCGSGSKVPGILGSVRGPGSV